MVDQDQGQIYQKIHKGWTLNSPRRPTGETLGLGEEEALNANQGASMKLNDNQTVSILAPELANVPSLRTRLIRQLLDSRSNTRPFSNLILFRLVC